VESNNYDLAYLDVRDSISLGGILKVQDGLFTNCSDWAQAITESEVNQNTQEVDRGIEVLDGSGVIAGGEEGGNKEIIISGSVVKGGDSEKGGSDMGEFDWWSVLRFINNDDENKKYKRWYRQGKYKTMVIVFEGKVVTVPYDEKGIKIDKIKTISAGQSVVHSGEVK